MSWDELRIHRWIEKSFGGAGLVGGRGHDAAALSKGLARPVLCTDQTVTGVHVDERAKPGAIGHKACARALSDLAASAARPAAVLVSLALADGVSEAWVRGVLRGAAATAERHGAILAGGDLAGTRSGASVVSVTAVGEGHPAGRPTRAKARAGQLLVVTGPLGGSGRGRHLRFEPRLDAGRALVEAGARCLMDTTDGLALDLSRLARASSVRLEVESVPIHAAARRNASKGGPGPLERALHDGEDYELIAALSRPAWERAADHPALAEASVIGRVRAGAGLYVPAEEGAELRRWRYAPGRGWSHAG